MQNKTVLFIEDSDDLRLIVPEALAELGCQVVCAASGSAALGELQNGLIPDVFLLDLTLPDMTAVDFQSRAVSILPEAGDTPWVVASGRVDVADWAKRLNAFKVLKKPYDFDILNSTVESALKRG